MWDFGPVSRPERRSRADTNVVGRPLAARSFCCHAWRLDAGLLDLRPSRDPRTHGPEGGSSCGAVGRPHHAPGWTRSACWIPCPNRASLRIKASGGPWPPLAESSLPKSSAGCSPEPAGAGWHFQHQAPRYADADRHRFPLAPPFHDSSVLGSPHQSACHRPREATEADWSQTPSTRSSRPLTPSVPPTHGAAERAPILPPATGHKGPRPGRTPSRSCPTNRPRGCEQ